MDVCVILGSKSDLEVGKKISSILKKFDLNYSLNIVSAHRSPEELDKLIDYAESKGTMIYICVAGMSAHLPGIVASKTLKPVIGLPVSSNLLGIDSLLSMVQMPRGIPVGVVGIDNAENASLLAVKILALFNDNIKAKLIQYRKEKNVVERDLNL
ncbi:MAG: 5-(carboxyamino)imidazole ribonucleotide mutase [Candidatus Hydrothermarchaeota archaeon]